MKTIIKHCLVILLCLLLLFPFIFVILGATHDSAWAFNSFFEFEIGKYFWQNYQTVLQSGIWTALFNSLFTSAITSILSLVCMTACSYALAKYAFRGKDSLISLLAIILILPQPTYLIGQLKVIKCLQLYSTFGGLIFPFIINIKILFFIKSACENITDEIIDASRMDGASEYRIMLKISLPIISDKLWLALFFLFISSWNNFLIPMIITNSSKLFTLPIFTSSLADPMKPNTGAVFMSLIFSVLPIILLFIIFSNKIIKDDE